MKKIIMMTLMALAVALAANAEPQKNGKGKVYEVVEVMPEFPGGIPGLLDFLKKNQIYPESSIKRKEEGRVMAAFVVNTDGSVCDIAVIKHVSPALDKAAVDMIKKMPKWIPGKHNGKAVRVKYVLPVVFKIQ